MNIRIGNGYDVHALAEGLPLWLGGVQIESPIGCIAHSDGDVAIHALCDALLGALALGDIGKHYYDEITVSVLLYHQIPYAYVLHTSSFHSHSTHFADTKLE